MVLVAVCDTVHNLVLYFLFLDFLINSNTVQESLS